jgi:hypothetical protein
LESSVWTKKNKEFKGKNYYYSLKNKLQSKGKINDSFELILNNLTLEEVIGLKLELSSSYINNRLYNIPIWNNIYYICKEAVLKYALSSCRSIKDAASFIGVSESDFRKELKKFQITMEIK